MSPADDTEPEPGARARIREAGARPRIGLVGARRARQGLGPFVARELGRAGWEVPALLATSRASGEAARAGLLDSAGIDARVHTQLAAFLAEGLDALAVLSPAGTHGRYLEAALEAGLHVLCEKPLLTEGPDPVAAVRRLCAGFDERGLVLLENCQWPETLPAFRTLHPDLDLGAGPPRRFTMRLSPASRGAALLVDGLPHPLSLLQVLAPASRITLADVRFSSRDPEAEEFGLELAWLADGHRVEVSVELVRSPVQPREMGYAVDGREARRLVRMADYRLFLAAGAALVDLPDPLGRRVERFTNLVTRAGMPATAVLDPEAPPDAAAGRARRPAPAAGSTSVLVASAAAGLEPFAEATPEASTRAIVQRTELLLELLEAFEGGPA